MEVARAIPHNQCQMAELAGVDARRPASRWVLRALYAVLVVAAVAPTALFTLVAGLAAYAVGWVKGAQSFRTSGARALAFVVIAVGVIVIEESVL
jgi:hypothetical protein